MCARRRDTRDAVPLPSPWNVPRPRSPSDGQDRVPLRPRASISSFDSARWPPFPSPSLQHPLPRLRYRKLRLRLGPAPSRFRAVAHDVRRDFPPVVVPRAGAPYPPRARRGVTLAREPLACALENPPRKNGAFCREMALMFQEGDFALRTLRLSLFSFFSLYPVPLHGVFESTSAFSVFERVLASNFARVNGRTVGVPRLFKSATDLNRSLSPSHLLSFSLVSKSQTALTTSGGITVIVSAD